MSGAVRFEPDPGRWSDESDRTFEEHYDGVDAELVSQVVHEHPTIYVGRKTPGGQYLAYIVCPTCNRYQSF